MTITGSTAAPRGKKRGIRALLLALVSVLMLAPVALTVLYAFFSPGEMGAYLATRGRYDPRLWMDLRLSPAPFSMEQMYTLLIEKPVYLAMFGNSALYTAGILLCQALVIPMLAYGLSLFAFRGRDALVFLIIAFMLLPFQVTMSQNVLVLRALGLMNTRWAVILPMAAAPFYIFLLRQYMVTLPGEMLEAALLDGAGTWRCFIHIVLPVCRPILGAGVALSFADCWNMAEQPLVYLAARPERMPLSVTLSQINTENGGIAFAGAALYMLPALLVYVCFQEDILLGIQTSSLK